MLSLVQEVIQEQRKALSTRHILMKLAVGDEVPVIADPDRIGQVLTNYLTNGLWFTLPLAE